ncbi:cadmium-translocating P-type ATPase [Candidatus Kaiserbacteria bacterium RIFCSPHIGHO2_12_FULL_53_13]|uniref:Cadmium-translocating P-type ATPase n=1 Tax=Candidatus Kaiserbacteria bacterium RIFCSPHIGHO2_12_FULL_53_13 TaxID=1798502 RepID=A0A1F6EBZ1_9BACT|nr:MAG: cadmium-translocating P-type ATPase [Candidatus Kaiserbacteria bacterium RIFCSPHIGHO2_12_FULL_53_13]OGG74760.1 MAG: cadmium-translocating P-type ATPase [Candidatus Kaiserbacteria bacterium RIFCSPLOWO2_01_FULL_52_36]
MKNIFRKEFRPPLAVLALLAVGAAFPAFPFWVIAIVLGIAKITWDSIEKIREKSYSLDYIALLAMVVSLFAHQYLAGAVVALMITGGEALDEYASARAEGALRGLAERIPKFCTVRSADGSIAEKPIQNVASGETIIIKPNELIPLDGTILSSEALLNEANLTGEAAPVSFSKGEFAKSGGINVGEILELVVEGGFETSTYMRIVHLVDEAKKHQAHIVRLAEQVNFPFTAITLALAAGAYLLSHELSRSLAVLVIATPCPLIIAAPVAFIGGLSRAARRNIIVKRPATLEELSRASVVFFDKTGTLTLGEISLTKIEVLAETRTATELLAVASAIEFHSIHPLARAIQTAGSLRKAPILEATNVVETIGHGIAGDVKGSRYTISKAEGTHDGIALSLLEGEQEVAQFHFEDEVKENVAELFRALAKRGISIRLLTGDKRANAERLFGKFGITILAECTPESKYAAIDSAKNGGATVVMVGDGLNDAPALAHANVGIVFSGTENSAAIEAANAVILGRDVMLIEYLFDTASRSMRIAGQSIWGGVALSSVGMLFAAFGFIPPVAGALTQEVIDVAVILNSLRTAVR